MNHITYNVLPMRLCMKKTFGTPIDQIVILQAGEDGSCHRLCQTEKRLFVSTRERY